LPSIAGRATGGEPMYHLWYDPSASVLGFKRHSSSNPNIRKAPSNTNQHAVIQQKTSLQQVCPNPTADILHLPNLNEPAIYQILDLSGKVVQYGQTNGTPISLANLQAGLYHLQIFSPELTQQHFKLNKID